MNVKCWNCGTEREVAESEIRQSERRAIVDELDRHARLAGTCGDIYRANAFRSAMEFIEPHYQPSP